MKINKFLIITAFSLISGNIYASVDDQKRIFLGVFFMLMLFGIIAIVNYTKRKSFEIKYNIKSDRKILNQRATLSKKKNELKEIFKKKIISEDEYQQKLKAINKELQDLWIEESLYKNENYINIIKAFKKKLISEDEKNRKISEIKSKILSKAPKL